MFSIKQKMTARYERLLEERSNTLHKIQSSPPGNLLIFSNPPGWKWFCRIKDPVSSNTIRRYIPKNSHAEARTLAKKTYLQYHLADLNQEIKALSMYLSHCIDDEKRTDRLLNKNGWADLLQEYMDTDTEKWLQEPYDKKQISPEDQKVRAIHGEFVRSKSEALIAMVLYQHNIPFRYECKWDIDKRTVYPDFTILHPKTHQLLIWEHFGLIDDSIYLSNMFSKLRLYIRNGFIPFYNLIMTFESKEVPLDSALLEALAQYYF